MGSYYTDAFGPQTGMALEKTKKLAQAGLIRGTIYDPQPEPRPHRYTPPVFTMPPPKLPRSYGPPPEPAPPVYAPVVVDQFYLYSQTSGRKPTLRPPSFTFDDLSGGEKLMVFLLIYFAWVWPVSSVLKFFGMAKENAIHWAGISFWVIFCVLIVLSVICAVREWWRGIG